MLNYHSRTKTRLRIGVKHGKPIYTGINAKKYLNIKTKQLQTFDIQKQEGGMQKFVGQSRHIMLNIKNAPL